MSNELKANIADAQKFFDKTKCTSFAEVMVQYANSRPTEPKTKIAEGLKALMLRDGRYGNLASSLIREHLNLDGRQHLVLIDDVLDALLAICDEVES